MLGIDAAGRRSTWDVRYHAARLALRRSLPGG